MEVVEQKPKLEEESNDFSNKRAITTDSPPPDLKKIKLESQNGSNNLLIVPPTKPQLFYTPLKTGLVYDVRMRYHAKIFTSYFEYIDPHPEDPRRIYRIYKKLAEAGIIQDSSLSGTDDIGPLMTKIPIREATAEEILEVHSEEHLKYIQSTENMTRENLLDETEKGDSVYFNNDSFLSAKLSCGGAIEACKAVVEGKVKNSLAVVRPPGHHAEPDSPAGFCLFSNVAVAAKNILKQYPESVRRIVILDWDIHHGNGTQRAFYNNCEVLYISIHRYENGRFYPGTKYGNSTVVGEGVGEGFCLNIPWRSAGMHDGDYVYAFNRVIIPVITEFNPDLVIISSGFDAADGDVIGGCHVSPAGYGYMTHMLKAIAKGKLAVVLEGGYNLDSISKSALAVAKVLVGEPPENTISQEPHLEAIEVIDEVIKIHSKYWNCFKHGIPTHSFDDLYDLLTENPASKLVNLADPIRSYQANEMFTKFSFINLPIVAHSRNNEKQASFTIDLPPQLEDVILASQDIYDCSTVIVTIHDPPDVWANIDPINGSIRPSSSVVLEYPLSRIINRIRSELEKSGNEEKIGYIDINIPPFPLPIPGSRQQKNSNYNPTIFGQELLLYVWTNYLSYFSQMKKLVFVGFGESYQSIVHLYAKRPSHEIKDLVKGTIAYVDRSALKPLVPVMDESMVDWYYQNSVIFTSTQNPCWAGSSAPNGVRQSGNANSESKGDDGNKRPRKKFGRVIRATSDGLWDVISERFNEGMDFILDSIEDFTSESSN